MKKIIILFVSILIVNCSKESEPTMYTLTVTSNPTEGGTISPSGGEYEDGTVLTIRVTPNTNYEFDRWSGSLSGRETSLSITMDSNKSIVGNFVLSDTDGDGVTDDVDQCNDTPSGQTVDSNGCSDSQKDTDGDGVSDDLDTCPDTLSGETVDENGCSDSQKDTDGDGVNDDVDTCPDTPSGETVDSNGCSDSQKDTDGDGVMDDKDTCTETPDGEEVDENGCSDSQKDTDGDGVNDDVDTCPDTPSGETVDSNGCSDSQKDTDGDGVNDDVDLCNSTITGRPVNEWGCQNPIYLDDNGVTIKSYEWGEDGDLGKVDDTYYIVVSDHMVSWNRREFMLSNYINPYLWLKEGWDGSSTPVFFPIQRGNYRKYKPCTSKLTKEGLRRFYLNVTPSGTYSSYDLSHWDVSQITDMYEVFRGNYNGPQELNYGDLSNWDVSNVTNMTRMFSQYQGYGNVFSNETMNSLSGWDVSNVQNMGGIFYGSNFNGDISNWDVSNVTIMGDMFSNTPFNKDVSNWDVSNVQNMGGMFKSSEFNGDLSNWNVSNVTYCNGFSTNTPQWTLPKPNFTNCNPN